MKYIVLVFFLGGCLPPILECDSGFSRNPHDVNCYEEDTAED